jgi:hypothetical protein
MNSAAVNVDVSNAAPGRQGEEATRGLGGDGPGARRPVTRTISRSTECIALALRVTEKRYPDRIPGRAAD